MRTRKSGDLDLHRVLSSTDISTVGCYRMGKTVGQGTFGKVKLGNHLYTGNLVAIKIIDKIHAPVVAREIETLKNLKHPNIAQLYEILTTETKIYMVLEYAEGGEFFDYIAQYKKMDDKSLETKKIFWQMTDAIRYCHEKNFCHRDLKLENILLDKNFNVKIIDFGFTRTMEENKLLDTFCGSPAYAAPEIILAEKYSGKAADVWSLGIILFTMVTGYLPFDEDDETDMHKKVLGLDFTIPNFLQNDTVDLLNKMIVRDPNDRFTLQNVLAHPWFDSLKESDSHFSQIYKDDMNDMSLLNPKVLKKLKILGFQTEDFVKSVKSQYCDSRSALCHFIAMKSALTSSSSSSIHNPTADYGIKITEFDTTPSMTDHPTISSLSIETFMHQSTTDRFGEEYRRLSFGESTSPIKSARSSWTENSPISNVHSMRRNMRGSFVADRGRSLSATASSLRNKKKGIVEEQEEDLLF